ncbi:CheY-like chemotaxis protein [Actinoplanes octamycinicus]|uniref:CheY-like chemotaxis protein n=1 Tax=Actinoplanes octamycinicus TaxID=135948 RepID=A0A7W7GZI6_9ACTN|nr:response regulator [Actinoplanes octamycinicus]MBB4741148.1 CheY-like chemotaxis protein [Actinoplanes octamycinicus]GIE56055.1 response regulator [Actinoplanes octamycinicus]
MTTLVVADDHDDIRMIMARVLRRAGYTVVEAADGAEALRAVREQTPAAVVSDIDMPVMSGVDLCREIRADAATRDLPVLFVSGSLMPGDDRPARAQATAVITKPFTPQGLVESVRALVTASG